MTFLFQSILKHNLFFWSKAEFSAAITPVFSIKHLLLLSVLKKNCCAAEYFCENWHFIFWNIMHVFSVFAK